MSGHCAKFHVCGFGLALGVITAICMFLLGLSAIGGYGMAYVSLIGSVYVGYGATFLGSIIGAIWGFIEGFIFGVVFAWLYNCFVGKCCKTCRAKEGEKTQ